MSDLAARIAEARAAVAQLEREAVGATCSQLGQHDWRFRGGRNCGCHEWASCSLPVYECQRCGDCDYGENAEARDIIDDCDDAEGEPSCDIAGMCCGWKSARETGICSCRYCGKELHWREQPQSGWYTHDAPEGDGVPQDEWDNTHTPSPEPHA